MSLKLYLFRILALLYLIMPLSCAEEVCYDSCCGETFEQGFTKIDSVKLVSGRLDSTVYTIIEYEFIPVISNHYETAALEIGVFNSQIAVSQSKKREFSLINESYACSPPLPSPSQFLESIEIFSDSSISYDNEVFDPGTDLVELFVIAKQFSDQQEIAVKAYIENQKIKSIEFGDYGETLILKLKDFVAFPQNTLSIRITLDDNSTFSVSTKEFTIE